MNEIYLKKTNNWTIMQHHKLYTHTVCLKQYNFTEGEHLLNLRTSMLVRYIYITYFSLNITVI